MKTTSTLLAFIMTLSSFETKTIKIDAAENLASQIVKALQNASIEEYAVLFPSLTEFERMMDANSSLYHGNLQAAKDDFEMSYMNKALPELKKAFVSIIDEGKKAGIEWSEIKLTGIQVDENSQKAFGTVPMTLTVTSKGKEYRIQLEKVLILNSHWKVSQYIKLKV